MDLILRIRRRPKDDWTQNHHVGGWKVRNADNTGWIDMNPDNTAIANPNFDPKQTVSDSNPAWLFLKALSDMQKGV